MTKVPAGAFVWTDGHVVAAAEARVSAFDRGLLYGDSVYEVTRTVGGRPLFLDAHLARLAASAEGLGMALPPDDVLRGAIAATLAPVLGASGRAEGQAASDAYLRVVVTRGAGEINLDPAAADEPTLLVYAKPLALPDPRCYREGVTVAVTGLRRNAPGHVPARIKSGNYLSSVMAYGQARRAGAYEAVLTDLSGVISEGASSNLFWVRGGRLGTTPLALGVLAGVTRAAVLALPEAAGAAEEAVLPEELAAVDEVFLTSSVRGLVPVVRLLLDGEPRVIGDGTPGPRTRALLAAYEDRLRAEAR